jgi:hypothetical protein
VPYATVEKYREKLEGEYEARCPHCGWTTKLQLHTGCGLNIGDSAYLDPSHGVSGCLKCKRSVLVITRVPPPSELPSPKGFWKIPTE